VLQLEDGTRLAQSNAILWFLGEGTEFLPGDPLSRAQVAQWLFFEQEWVVRGIGAARFWILTERETALIPARLTVGARALSILDSQLTDRNYLVGSHCTIADISNFAYTHVAGDAGYELADYPAVARWLERIPALPGYLNDLVPYPDNARPGNSRSIYD
jgi:glutathione S-transferase